MFLFIFDFIIPPLINFLRAPVCAFHKTRDIIKYNLHVVHLNVKFTLSKDIRNSLIVIHKI